MDGGTSDGVLLVSISESDVDQKIKRWCDINGVLYIKFNPFGSRGWPDRIAIFPSGFHLWIELKRKGKKPRKLQFHRIEQLNSQGAVAVYFDNAEECIAELTECLAAAKEIRNEVDTPPIPDTRRTDISEAVRSRPVVRPRDGEDNDGPSSV